MFNGEHYEAGEIRISEDEKTIVISQLKKSFLSSEMIHVGQTSYSDSTKVSGDGLRIRINDLSFEADDSITQSQIKEIVTKPYRLERERREKIIKSADTSVINFLQERAKAMDDLRELIIKPREAILRKIEKVGDGEDPVTLYRKMLAQSLNQPYSEMDSGLQSLKLVLDEVNMRRVYAMIFGVASVQTAMLGGADPAKPLELLEKVATKKLSRETISDHTIIEATNLLYSEIALLNPEILLG